MRSLNLLKRSRCEGALQAANVFRGLIGYRFDPDSAASDGPMQAVYAGGVLLAEPGEIMKKLFLALLAVAAALAITPVALADSFSYSINGSNFTANLTFQANPD